MGPNIGDLSLANKALDFLYYDIWTPNAPIHHGIQYHSSTRCALHVPFCLPNTKSKIEKERVSRGMHPANGITSATSPCYTIHLGK